MATWKPDSCTCILEFLEAGNLKKDFVDFVERCKQHQSATYDDIINHNKSFNLSGKTEEEITNDKRIERERIKKL